MLIKFFRSILNNNNKLLYHIYFCVINDVTSQARSDSQRAPAGGAERGARRGRRRRRGRARRAHSAGAAAAVRRAAHPAGRAAGEPRPTRPDLPAASAALTRPIVLSQRSRKCSIVREEEDDEEGAVAGAARHVDARRGSRSEGRLHLAARAAHHTPVAAQRPAHLADNLTKVSPRSSAPGLPVRSPRGARR